MKKSLSLIAVFLLTTSFLIAQDDKALRKEWENKKKGTDAMDFKKVYDENESLKAEIAAKKNSLVDLESSVAQKSEDFRKLKEEYELYRNNVNTATAPEKNNTDATITTPEKRQTLTKGVVFKVQIGAFKNKDLRKYFENNKNFSGDVDPDGIKKYTLGYFNEYWEAETFKKYLREMGVRDAWIVPYKDGQRVSIRDVLEGIL